METEFEPVDEAWNIGGGRHATSPSRNPVLVGKASFIMLSCRPSVLKLQQFQLTRGCEERVWDYDSRVP